MGTYPGCMKHVEQWPNSNQRAGPESMQLHEVENCHEGSKVDVEMIKLLMEVDSIF